MHEARPEKNCHLQPRHIRREPRCRLAARARLSHPGAALEKPARRNRQHRIDELRYTAGKLAEQFGVAAAHRFLPVFDDFGDLA
jgi:hypothetical protein